MKRTTVARMLSLSRQVAERRRDRGMSQSEFGAFVGVPRDVINLLESGICMPKADEIALIATGLGVSEAVLFDEAIEEPSYHAVRDVDSDSITIAYFDGSQWYLPGSARAFPKDCFEGENCRFRILDRISMPVRGKPWNPLSGSFT